MGFYSDNISQITVNKSLNETYESQIQLVVKNKKIMKLKSYLEKLNYVQGE